MFAKAGAAGFAGTNRERGQPDIAENEADERARERRQKALHGDGDESDGMRDA